MPDLTGIRELLSRLVGAPVSLGFGALLVVHIAAGLVCVVSGAVALLSPKQQGRHPRFGVVYYGALGVVFATATVLGTEVGPKWLFVLSWQRRIWRWLDRLPGAKVTHAWLAHHAHHWHELVVHRAGDRFLCRQRAEVAAVGPAAINRQHGLLDELRLCPRRRRPIRGCTR